MEINSVANENVQYLPRLYSRAEYYEKFFCQTEFEKVSVIYRRMLFGSTGFFGKSSEYKLKDMLDARL